MYPKFTQRVRDITPKMNPMIAKNIVVDKLDDAEQYVDRLWRNSQSSLPKDMVYHRLRRCSASEQFMYLSQQRGKDSTKLVYDIAPSNNYMVMLEFRWYGDVESGNRISDQRDPGKNYKTIQHPVLLITCGQGGKTQLRGANFVLRSVAADPVISYTKDTAFIMLPRDKITVKRTPYQYFSNDTFGGEPAGVYMTLPHSTIYHLSSQKEVSGDTINKASVTTLGHYLFAKYGVSESFRRFAGVEAHTGRNLSTRDYPLSDWIIYSTMGVVPRGFSIAKSGKTRNSSAVRYRHPDVQIAVRRGGTEKVVKGLVGSFLYLVDRYYDRFPDDVAVEESANAPSEWRIMLGLIIFNNNEADHRLLRDINLHMDSLDLYIDTIQTKKFQDEGIPCSDFYEFLAYLIEHVADGMSVVDTTTMFGKELMVLEYVMEEIRTSIFKLGFGLKTTERGKQQNHRKAMTNKDIEKALRKFIRTDAIMNVHSSKSGGRREKIAESVQAPGDCMLFKVSTSLVLQSRTAGTSTLSDDSSLISASIAFCCSFLNLPHAEPTGKSKANVFAKPDSNGRFVITDEIAADVRRTEMGLIKDVGRFDEELNEIVDSDFREEREPN